MNIKYALRRAQEQMDKEMSQRNETPDEYMSRIHREWQMLNMTGYDSVASKLYVDEAEKDSVSTVEFNGASDTIAIDSFGNGVVSSWVPSNPFHEQVANNIARNYIDAGPALTGMTFQHHGGRSTFRMIMAVWAEALRIPERIHQQVKVNTQMWFGSGNDGTTVPSLQIWFECPACGEENETLVPMTGRHGPLTVKEDNLFKCGLCNSRLEIEAV